MNHFLHGMRRAFPHRQKEGARGAKATMELLLTLFAIVALTLCRSPAKPER
jgi:hypothetical protein